MSKFSYPKFHRFSKAKNSPDFDFVKVLSPTQNGIETFSSSIKLFIDDLNRNLSSSEITFNELMAILTCFDSSKSLLSTAFLLSHFWPSIDILSVKNNQFSILLGVLKTSFF